ncbi:MAG TPA: molybdate ABC transporter substrate-binding protein [Caulobacterales bacterium]|nr:molybdate ABC transporter substrate-binding protein [Caulobacterales bacterium]
MNPCRSLLCLLAALCVAFAPHDARAAPLRVFAAASLTDALNAIGDAYAAHRHERPVFNFAASSALARQIEQGAEADLYFSADEEWMNYLEARNLIDATTRVSALGNRLVLIAPADRPFRLAIGPNFDLAGALRGGRLAMADPDNVPAGRYGRAALERLGAWEAVSGSIVRAENVRAALRFVETGEAAAGIVYATDAQAAGDRVVRVGVFPESSHPPISYPVAILAGRGSAEARQFLRFLRSDEARATFTRLGFSVR